MSIIAIVFPDDFKVADTQPVLDAINRIAGRHKLDVQRNGSTWYLDRPPARPHVRRTVRSRTWRFLDADSRPVA